MFTRSTGKRCVPGWTSRRRRASFRAVGESLAARRLLADDTTLLADDFYQVHQNEWETALPVLANDSVPSDARILSVSSASQGGSVRVQDDGRALMYRPRADFAGTDTFVYYTGNDQSATVTVEVVAPLKDDFFTVVPDGRSRMLDVLANDPFWPGYGGDRQITLVSATRAGGSVEISSDGRTLEYTPPEDSPGATQDLFTYVVDDLYPAQVKVELPAALNNDRFEIIQNSGPQVLAVLANDPFWRGYEGPGKITHVLTTRSDSVTIRDDGVSLLYQPAADFAGWEQFRYVVDGQHEASVDVVVHRPVVDDYFEVDQDSQAFSVYPLANDAYWDLAGRPHYIVTRVTAVEQPDQGGSVTLSSDGQHVIYTPAAGFVGTESFRYVADDKYAAKVTMSVTRPVRDDYFNQGVYQDTPQARLDVLANDFLGKGYQGPRQITSVSETAAGGRVEIAGSVLLYTPADGFTGQDQFRYTVDGQYEAQAYVWVQPLAQGDYYFFCTDPAQTTYSLRVLENDFFNRGYPGVAKISSVSSTAHGAPVTIAADGTQLLYTASTGTFDSFTYTVDGKYETTVSVSFANHLASDVYVVDQNSGAVDLDVLANDFQNEWWGIECTSSRYSGPRVITGVTASASDGVVQLSADGGAVQYQPAPDFVGTDSFTYTVDGRMQAEVSVQVIRRVRDDRYRVAPDSETQVLPVLVNDLFGADYRGAQQITAVTTPTAGGVATIGVGGKSILYAPTAGFTGTDSFVYTVDGRLKAKVDISVHADQVNPFPRFESLSVFQQFLIDDALERYAGLFGQPAWWYRGIETLDGGVAPTSEDRSHSETNVQVAGVDEADLMEFDEDYVYLVTRNEMVILDAWPAGQLHEVARAPILGTPIGAYLNGDRLTVVSRQDTFIPFDAEPDGPVGNSLRPWPVPGTFRSATEVTVFDVTNRTAPAVVQRTSLEGSYVESRAIGDYVYLVVANQGVAPPPLIKPLDPDDTEPPPPDPVVVDGRLGAPEINDFAPWGSSGVYETREEYRARIQSDLGLLVEEALPNYSSFGPDGQLVRSGLLNAPEDIFRPLSEQFGSLVSVVSINVTGSEPGLGFASGVYTTSASKVYGSLENLFVFEGDYAPEDGAVTRILKFDWDPSSGGIDFVAAGYVPGWMLNQFSADEYQGHLRIATTINNWGSGNWSGRAENVLFVLRDDAGVLEYVGGLQNLGLDETIRSVRYMGERALVVTFRNVDPLFGLDLSDPAAPRALGHLTIPGFSSYMHFVGEDRLLTVGRSTPDGWSGPAEVSLFDVSNLTQPYLLDRHTFARFAESEAQVDHHAFGYFAEHGLLAVPTSRSYSARFDEDGDGYRETWRWLVEYELAIFRIDPTVAARSDSGIVLVGTIAHESPVRRSGYIGDKLYSIADDSVKVVDVSDPATVLATVEDITHDPPPPPPVPLDPLWPFAEGQTQSIHAAQADLAARLALPVGGVLLVAAEPPASAADPPMQIVLRVGDKHFLYSADAQGTVALKDSDYQFASINVSDWHNEREPADVNGDGEVAPNDPLLVVDQVNRFGSFQIAANGVVRQIIADTDPSVPRYRYDVNGDGWVTELDALVATNRLNERSAITIDLAGVDLDDFSRSDPVAVDRVFTDLGSRVGDVNWDGRFDSSDLVRIFQAGEYEDGAGRNSTWADGDWDGDRDFTSSDLVLAFRLGNYRAAASAEPETLDLSAVASALSDARPSKRVG